MNARPAARLIASLTLVALTTLVLGCSSPSEGPAEGTSEAGGPRVEAEGDQARLLLYFPGGGGSLVAEERSIEIGESGADLTAIAAEVLAGPTSPGLHAPFPAETTVGSVFISQDAVAYVDLVSTRANPPSSGSRQEMLSVYSLVNSVLANLPELSAVVLLWNGQQRPTFAGHLDTGRPLKENPSLVAR